MGEAYDKTGAEDSRTSVEMPRYRCHKDVWALKIKAISAQALEPKTQRERGMVLTFEEEGYAPRAVSAQYVARHQPIEGGYFVVYKDGYESFSPATTFEEIATRQVAIFLKREDQDDW